MTAKAWQKPNMSKKLQKKKHLQSELKRYKSSKKKLKITRSNQSLPLQDRIAIFGFPDLDLA